MRCPAPLHSRWFGADGLVKACCVSNDVWGDLHTTLIQEIENSPVRETQIFWLQQDKVPEGCNFCVRSGLDNPSNPIGFAKRLGPGPDVTFVDLTWGNLCNFACVHCNPRLSSTIQKQYKDVWPIWTNDVINHDRVYSSDFINQQKLDFILSTPTIKLIHLNGGEPLLQPETWALLDGLKVQGRDTTSIWLHTNGSINSYKGKNLLDYLKTWKGEVHITMSHDHYGKRGEWFRYGYKDRVWLETFNRWKNAGIDITVQTSVNILNILTLDQLWQWYDSVGVLEYARLQLTQALDPQVWSLYNLPKQQLQDRLQSLKFPQFHLRNNWHMEISRLARTESPVDFSKFRESVDALDAKRKTNFLDTFPELEEFYLQS